MWTSSEKVLQQLDIQQLGSYICVTASKSYGKDPFDITRNKAILPSSQDPSEQFYISIESISLRVRNLQQSRARKVSSIVFTIKDVCKTKTLNYLHSEMNVWSSESLIAEYNLQTTSSLDKRFNNDDESIYFLSSLSEPLFIPLKDNLSDFHRKTLCLNCYARYLVRNEETNYAIGFTYENINNHISLDNCIINICNHSYLREFSTIFAR